MKETLRSYAIGIGLLIGLWACQPSNQSTQDSPAAYTLIEGQTMGTYYRITFLNKINAEIKSDVEKTLAELNKELSTYDKNSLISAFNRSNRLVDTIPARARHFFNNLTKSYEVYQLSKGAFDPTVAPLVNYWGFGFTGNQAPSAVDTNQIQGLLGRVGMNKLRWTKTGSTLVVNKQQVGIQLDFNAIAPGYAVDELGRLLESKGLDTYLIDIGGEVLAKGLNPQGKDWTLGISTPKEGAAPEDIQTTLRLHNQALATSGNYRKYYAINGVKYSHTINPKTGFPERSNLLSASVIAPDAMTADAYATVCMVLGLKKGFALIDSLPNLEAYFIYGDAQGGLQVKYTSGFKEHLNDVQ